MKSCIIRLLVILLVSLVFVAADESNFISDLLEEFPGVYEFRKYAANQYCFGNNNFKCNSQGKITEIQIENVNQNGHVPVSISTITELHKIDISNSSIELDWNNINNIKKLDVLIFSGNKHRIVKFPTLTIDLKYLDLSNTRFDGELTNLPSTLLYINISNTGLTGSVPSFINNPNLKYLDVSNNKLKGDLPDFDRTNLLILNASNNMLTNNNTEFNRKISIIDLSKNKIENSFSFIYNKKLSILNISSNLLKTIPSIDPSSLSILDLSNNKISGFLHNTFDDMIKLTKINVSSNSLSGQISQFRDNNQLVSVDLSNNGFSGKIPTFERNTKLVYLNLSMNLFSEMKSFSKNTNLEILDVSSNKITVGGDVQAFENNIRLSILNMSQNGLVRVSEINAPNLSKLDISSCQLNNITNFELKKLKYLNLSHNRLNQEVPDTKELPKLSELYLHHNQLTGELPSFKFNSELSIIDISYNRLSGKIPQLYRNLKLSKLNLSNNQLSDNIPSFTRHEKLVMLDLSYNKLSGQFPAININIRELRLNGNADLTYSCKEDILRDTYLNDHVCDLGTVVIDSDADAECAKNVNAACKVNLLSGTESVYYIGILQILVVATGLMLIY